MIPARRTARRALRQPLRPTLCVVSTVIAVAVFSGCGQGSTNARRAAGDRDRDVPTTTSSSTKPSSTGDRTGVAATSDSSVANGVAKGPAVASPGCRAGATPPVSLERRTLPVAELTRWYLITVPARANVAAAPTTPMPLVLDFHGLTEGAEAHAQMSGMGTYAEAHGFVAVLPQGTGDLAHWAAGPGGDASSPNSDLDFVAALLDRVTDDACIDLSRVYAAGLSNGAMFTSLLACRMANRFAAIAPIAGATDFDGCAPTATVPMLTIHGTADPILLFNGGVGELVKLMSGGDSAAGVPSTTTIPTDLNGPGYPANVAAWARRNGCDPTPTDTPVAATVTRRSYNCPAGADVEMYIVAGGGHAWPGSEFSRNIEKIVGPTTFDIDATDLIWKFFQRFRRA